MISPARSLGRVSRGVLLLIGGVAAVAGLTAMRPAGATRTPHVVRFHLALAKSEPAANDSLAASPRSLTLWFTESVQASATSVRITGPANHRVATGATTVDTKPKAPAVIAIKETLAAGTYNVVWKTMADDGHPSTGKFLFTIRAAHN